MKIYAINGSPRKNHNTDKMMKSFIEGAKSMGEDIETENIYLFDYDFKGCYSCFACKLKNSKSYGVCSYPDEMKEILKKVSKADGIVCASPIYFHDISGQLHAFLERLFFQYHSFVKGEKSLAPKNIQSAMIYTMNITEKQMRSSDYQYNLSLTQKYFDYTFYSKPETIYAFNTLLFNDYSNHALSYWDVDKKKDWHRQQFPKDLQNAYEAGRRMVERIRRNNVEV